MTSEQRFLIAGAGVHVVHSVSSCIQTRPVTRQRERKMSTLDPSSPGNP
jgi:hypothetical protein